jgi:hypothetical protein
VHLMKVRIGEACKGCLLPGIWHFRGNGSRFVGCAGAQIVAERLLRETNVGVVDEPID